MGHKKNEQAIEELRAELASMRALLDALLARESQQPYPIYPTIYPTISPGTVPNPWWQYPTVTHTSGGQNEWGGEGPVAGNVPAMPKPGDSGGSAGETVHLHPTFTVNTSMSPSAGRATFQNMLDEHEGQLINILKNKSA